MNDKANRAIDDQVTTPMAPKWYRSRCRADAPAAMGTVDGVSRMFWAVSREIRA
jgi:hypothetical protein